jgi:hypothetical protein
MMPPGYCRVAIRRPAEIEPQARIETDLQRAGCQPATQGLIADPIAV